MPAKFSTKDYISKSSMRGKYFSTRGISLPYDRHYLITLLVKATNKSYSSLVAEGLEAGMKTLYKKYGIDFPALDRCLTNDECRELIKRI
jgi:hypothetical protein